MTVQSHTSFIAPHESAVDTFETSTDVPYTAAFRGHADISQRLPDNRDYEYTPLLQASDSSRGGYGLVQFSRSVLFHPTRCATSP
jgi:hypothetical protein